MPLSELLISPSDPVLESSKPENLEPLKFLQWENEIGERTVEIDLGPWTVKVYEFDGRHFIRYQELISQTRASYHHTWAPRQNEEEVLKALHNLSDLNPNSKHYLSEISLNPRQVRSPSAARYQPLASYSMLILPFQVRSRHMPGELAYWRAKSLGETSSNAIQDLGTLLQEELANKKLAAMQRFGQSIDAGFFSNTYGKKSRTLRHLSTVIGMAAFEILATRDTQHDYWFSMQARELVDRVLAIGEEVGVNKFSFTPLTEHPAFAGIFTDPVELVLNPRLQEVRNLIINFPGYWLSARTATNLLKQFITEGKLQIIDLVKVFNDLGLISQIHTPFFLGLMEQLSEIESQEQFGLVEVILSSLKNQALPLDDLIKELTHPYRMYWLTDLMKQRPDLAELIIQAAAQDSHPYLAVYRPQDLQREAVAVLAQAKQKLEELSKK